MPKAFGMEVQTLLFFNRIPVLGQAWAESEATMIRGYAAYVLFRLRRNTSARTTCMNFIRIS